MVWRAAADDSIHYYRSDGGGIESISGAAGVGPSRTSHSIAVNQDGTVFVSWVAEGGHTVISTRGAGGEWSEPEVLARAFGGGRTSLATDGSGAPRVIQRGNDSGIFEVTGEERVIKRYSAGGHIATRVIVNDALADEPTNDLYFFLNDHLGSTTVVADAQGNEVGHVVYTPYGEIITSTLPLTVTDRLFTGQRWDATIGLYDFNARFYDPLLGQFTQPDSLIPQPGNPIAWNRYAYVYNNPANYTDSTGHFIDTLWDVWDLMRDVQDCFGDADSLACNMLPVDILAVALPFVPGIADNVLRQADEVAGAAKWADEAVAPSRALVPYDPEFAARQVDLRSIPGIAHGGHDLSVVTERWLRGSEANVGRIPRQIADQLRGRSFGNFGEFREALWKAVADDPHLATFFDEARNLPWMRKGYAPYVLPSQRTGLGRAQRKYILHHIELISQGGGVYDLDNILIATPRYHNMIHYGK